MDVGELVAGTGDDVAVDVEFGNLLGVGAVAGDSQADRAMIRITSRSTRILVILRLVIQFLHSA
jgi:hypothetical protein